MNEDGLIDLITPPQRGEVAGVPHIFLQDKHGSWREWSDVTWPRTLSSAFAYGSHVTSPGM